MVIRKRSTLVLLLAMLLFCNFSANAFFFGVIGDSMSTSANTKDNCDDAVECLQNLGTHTKFSFTHGEQPWSLLNRLKAVQPGLTGARSEAENGSRWDDAPEQAQMLMQKTPDVRIVHIEMGANDVCSDTLPTIPELAEIEFYVDETFTHLTNHMVNGAVIVSEVPDVVRVRDIHRTDPHFLFDTFQDLWDFDTDNLRSDAVDEICDEYIDSDILCNFFGLKDFIELILDEGLEELIDQTDAKFSCQRILGSGSTDADRQAARELNQQINALLAVKVQEYDGRNNNAFFLADNIDEGEFTRVEISDLDGFHLGRAGQEWLANLIWDRVGPNFFLPSAISTATTTTTSTTLPVSVTTTTGPGGTTTTGFVSTTTASVTTTTLLSSDLDTDGDTMTDLEEGNEDEDHDGIANFLDNFNLDRGQLQVDVHNPLAGTLRTNLGSLALGEISSNIGGTGARVTVVDIVGMIANAVDNGVEQSCVPDCFDFDVTALFAGITVKVVLPLSGPIPTRAVYRKLIDGVWSDFVVDATDGIGSAQLNGDDCPLPGDIAYTVDGESPNGLMQGMRCVQLWITDGGDNDADHMANGVIRDPGGIAVPASVASGSPDNDDDDGGSSGGCSVIDSASTSPLQRADLWLMLLLLVGLQIRRVGTAKSGN